MHVDTLIIGGGVIGLTVALELRRRQPHATITVLEAENELAAHGSGRNSGVLHSGIYYPPESLKAKMCAQGAAAMREYCRSRNLPLLPLGKVLVPERRTTHNSTYCCHALGTTASRRGCCRSANLPQRSPPRDRPPAAHSLYR